VIETLVDGLDHPEAVCWDPGAAVLWAGGEAGQLYRVDRESRQAEEVARAGLDGLVCANLGRWHLPLVDSGLRGAPLHYPDTRAANA
jgi:hypothetical protein